jgi:hypothetical protein
MPPKDMRTTIETPAEQPASLAEERLTLEQQIDALPNTLSEVVVPPNAATAGRQLGELREIIAVQQLARVDQQIQVARETTEITPEAAEKLAQAVEAKRNSLLQDPTASLPFRGYVYEKLGSVGGGLRQYSHQQAEAGPITGPLNGAANGALWAGMITAASTLVAGPVGTVVGVVGGTLGTAAVAKAGEQLQRLGVPKRVGGFLAKAAAIAGLVALAPAAGSSMGIAAVVGAALYGVNYLLNKAKASDSRQTPAEQQRQVQRGEAAADRRLAA